MKAQFSLPSAERQSLSGFQTVDRENRQAVSNEDLGKMMRTDELECLFLHFASLRHFGSIAERFSVDGDILVPDSEDAVDADEPSADSKAKEPSDADA